MTEPIAPQSRLRKLWEFRPRRFKMIRYDPCEPAPYHITVLAWGGKWRFEIRKL